MLIFNIHPLDILVSMGAVSFPVCEFVFFIALPGNSLLINIYDNSLRIFEGIVIIEETLGYKSTGPCYFILR
jgi:hypothetical protein